jgi:hypothetical protein
MAITPRMSNTAHRTPLRGHLARTPFRPFRSLQGPQRERGHGSLLSRGRRGPGTFGCGKCWPRRKLCESNVQWLTSVLSHSLSRPSWSRRSPCCPSMRVRRRKRNTGPIRRRCRSTAATPGGRGLAGSTRFEESSACPAGGRLGQVEVRLSSNRRACVERVCNAAKRKPINRLER